MSNESEYRDVNPINENLNNKGRTAIMFIAGGIALFILTFVGMRIRPVGLAVGSFTFVSGLMMLVRRKKFNYRPGLIVAVCGFLLLLANPRFGVIAGFAGYFLVIASIGLFVFGLFKAIKISWDLGKWS
ncbi:MAG: hypothetical protein FWD40_02305 [Treponema sp.]|nr:hypothetical protein [Treponema sp.]